MKQFITLLLSAIIFVLKTNAQTCTTSFVYTLSSNGSITFSNTSIPPTPTIATNYVWDFDDGVTFTTTSLSQTVSHTYSINANYMVSLSTVNSSTQCISTMDTQTITVMLSGCPLMASLSVSGGGLSNPNVNFTNLCTGTLSSSSYTWDFGDGNTSNLANPGVYTYTDNGIYQYSLKVSNSPTCSSFINVGFQEAFTSGNTYICSYTPVITYTQGAAGYVNFHVSNTSTGGNFINWFFDDNYLDLSGVTTTAHTYFNGSYTPTMWISIGPNCIRTPSTTITITNNPCPANASFTRIAMGSGAYQFSLTAPSSNSNIAYLWDFGDGITSTLSNVTHTYSSAGIYTPTLNAYHTSYSLSCTNTVASNVTVTGIPCIANSGFSIYPNGSPHEYWIIPSYPYNVTAVQWNWGDGSSSSNILYDIHTYSASGTYDVCLTVTTSCGSTGSTCVSQYLPKGSVADMVHIEVIPPRKTNAIAENESERYSVEMYPNPTEDFLTLKFEKEHFAHQLEIFDMLGKSVYVNYPNQNTALLDLDLGKLENGIYFLRLKIDRNTLTKKLIIQK